MILPDVNVLLRAVGFNADFGRFAGLRFKHLH